MKISVSNIAWGPEDDEAVFRRMREYGFSGLEIAPTRIIPDAPYDHIPRAARFAQALRERYGFAVSSMQSIWYGVAEKVFGPAEDRTRLTAYTKKAVDFAEAVGCGNLVFGCPRNRALPEGADPAAAVPFFRELGDYAAAHHTALSLEANPPIYGTNYINTTAEALELIREVNSEGFGLNLDTGAMAENGEGIEVLRGSEKWIRHVHISEPGLVPLRRRPLHRELASFLRSFSYAGFVSLEAARPENPAALAEMMEYVSCLFGS